MESGESDQPPEQLLPATREGANSAQPAGGCDEQKRDDWQSVPIELLGRPARLQEKESRTSQQAAGQPPSARIAAAQCGPADEQRETQTRQRGRSEGQGHRIEERARVVNYRAEEEVPGLWRRAAV